MPWADTWSKILFLIDAQKQQKPLRIKLAGTSPFPSLFHNFFIHNPKHLR